MRAAATALAAASLCLSAPALATSAEAGEQPRAHPEIVLDVPAEAAQGETLTVRGTFTNAGEADGSRIFLDVITDERGPDGDPETDDAVGLAGVAFIDTLTRGTDVAFDALGRAVHPFVRPGGAPEVLEGPAGALLWVAVDGYRETLLAGETLAFELALRVGKSAPAGAAQTVRLRAGLGRADTARAGSGAALGEFREISVTPRAVTLDEVVRQLAVEEVVSVGAAEHALDGSTLTSLISFAEGRNEPVRIAILPASIGAPGPTLTALAEGIALDGTLLVLVGERWLATSTRIAPADAQTLIDAEVAESDAFGSEGTARDFMLALDRFVASPPQPAAEPPASAAEPGAPPAPADGAPSGSPVAPIAAPAPGGGSSGNSGVVIAVIVLAVGALVVARPLRRAARGWSADRRQGADLRAQTEALVQRLGSDVGALVLEVERPDVPESARETYAVAVELHAEAQKRLAAASTNDDLVAAAKLAERGTRAIRDASAAVRRATR